jgi:hypothetical protein
MPAALRRFWRGLLGRDLSPRPSAIPETRWQDTPSGERPGWRERAAYLNGEEVFAVDYQVCRRCGLGWVEQPYT